MKKNVLVFPCGSEIALDIHSCIEYSAHFHFIGASSVDDHGKFVYDDYISGIPYITSPDFIPTIKTIVKERNIEAIYPALDNVMVVLKAAEEEIGCRVISSSLETTRICLSKSETYRILQGVLNIPKTYTVDTVESFPVFVKPDVGYGARGARKISSRDELKEAIAEKPDLLILDYLPGEEYTVDCFTDRKGNLLYSAGRIRNRIRDGISVNTSFAKDQKEFEEMAKKINSVIEFRGAWFYQVKRSSNGELYLLEIASRLGGSSLLSKAIGVNFPLLSLFDAFGYDVTVNPNSYYIELDRALGNKYKNDIIFDSVYCDYDDCLILDKVIVNTELVRFLFKCVNDSKKIFLLSKHEHTNLIEELKNFRLYQIFDEIIHIEPNANKADYITSSNAIFIDDSNAERTNIKKRHNIPVFSPDMIDVLI